ncbi:MAG: hypothetical protein C7B46_13775 [Sulfobacillus benefaciens]|uniref:Uncharacterized protein n=1 Tax=Sulfobacillus benefaciens TaxID=453960 RepID=A0A2T2XDL3_9FIRM|nr:MAG: hypothetical protein C7B46_13775 [Sulfobacillus benefaciens]
MPAGQPTSPTAIEYTVNQQASIAQVQPQAWVAREGFNSHYVRVNTATAATSHGKVLVLTYSNFLLQETGTANSFGTGGDIVKTSAVSLTIPGFGSSTPITGTMTTVDGIQHSGPHVVLTFRAPDGLYCDLLSTTLSSSQIEQIAESMSEI